MHVPVLSQVVLIIIKTIIIFGDGLYLRVVIHIEYIKIKIKVKMK